jgi:hypothetical protein
MFVRRLKITPSELKAYNRGSQLGSLCNASDVMSSAAGNVMPLEIAVLQPHRKRRSLILLVCPLCGFDINSGAALCTANNGSAGEKYFGSRPYHCDSEE